MSKLINAQITRVGGNDWGEGKKFLSGKELLVGGNQNMYRFYFYKSFNRKIWSPYQDFCSCCL